MAVKLCIKDSFPAAEYFANEGLIDIVKSPPLPPCIATIGKGNCACNTTHELIVDNKCVFFRDEENQLNSFPAYKLDGQFNDEELITILTWLTRSKFYIFQSNIQDGSLCRFLSRNIFKEQKSSCQRCYKYFLKGTPVFCLKTIVVSGRNKGPTLESVLSPCQKKTY